jgi:hypothetical protein
MVGRSLALVATVVLYVSLPARGQETTTPDEPSAVVNDSAAPAQGKLAIKPSEEDRPLSPWRRFPQHILSDQKAIWTSPLRINRENAKWWIGFGAATGALIATDKWTSKQLPNTKDQVEVAKWTSRIGASYTLVPLAGALYFTGAATNKHHLRETGLLAIEALTDTMIVTTAIKAATQRERPTEGDGNGRFWKGAGRFWNDGASVMRHK